MNRPIRELSEKIKIIEDKIRDQLIKTPKRIAVFDLDNTLIIHDIGEAVFARLRQAESSGPLTVDRKPLPLSWSRYQDLIEQGKKEEAYKKMVKAMAGLPLHTLLETTREIIRTRTRTLRIEGHSVPVPRVNRTMHALIRLLKKLQYRIYIISSSNHYSVRVIAETMLGIPGSCAFGIQSKMVDWPTAGHRNHFRVLTANLAEPVPVSRGKAAVYKKYIDSSPPLVTAGDSELDIHFLNLTHREGLSIWAGKDKKKYLLMKKKAKNPENFFFLKC